MITMQGRKNLPVSLHILNGNPSRLNLGEKIKNQPHPTPDLLDCPDYIKSDMVAYTEWNRIVPELYNLNLLTLVDKAALELYCTQYSVYRGAIEEIQKRGLTTNNIRNGEKALPQLAIAREAAKIIKSIAVEFGLTPSSRGRINMPGQDEDDPMEKHLSSKR